MEVCSSFRVQVPGVNRILGFFADFSKGYDICVSSDKSLVVDCTPRTDGIVRACMVKNNEQKKFSVSNTKTKKDDKWGNAIKGVYSALATGRENLPGMDMMIDGSIVECEGTILSSALAIATVKAVNTIAKLGLDENTMVRTAFSVCFNLPESCSYSEIITMMYGKPGHFFCSDHTKRCYSILENPFVGTDYSLVIIEAGVPGAFLKEEISYRYKEISRALSCYRDAAKCVFFDKLKRSDIQDIVLPMDDDTRRVIKMLYEEFNITKDAEALLRKKDCFAFGKILGDTYKNVRENLDSSCPEAEWLAKRAFETHKCPGTCIFYEGYVGKVVAVMENNAIKEYTNLFTDYQHIFGFAPHISVYGDVNISELIDEKPL